MVFCDQGRVTYRIKLKLHGAWVKIPTGTPNEELARAYDRTLATCLAHGMTEVVEAVHRKQVPLSLVHQELTQHGVATLTKRLGDRARQTDLKALIPVWVEECKRRGAPAEVTLKAYQVCLERLTAGRGCLMSHDLTPGWVNGRLSSMENARKAYSALRVWYKWLVRRGAVPGGLLEGIQSPPVPKAREDFLEERDIEKLLAKVVPEGQDAVAMAYGTGIEASVLSELTVEDVDLKTRVIRARGTKTKSRDRFVRCADWCWPRVEALVKATGEGRLFPGLDRWRLSDYHRDAAKAMGRDGLRLHDARRSWAVRLVKAGTPLNVVAMQLGHSSTAMVSKTYGRYVPATEEMDKWERRASGG